MKIPEFPKSLRNPLNICSVQKGPKIFWVLLGTFGCNCNLTIDGEAQEHNRIIKDSFHANANGYWSQATGFEAGEKFFCIAVIRVSVQGVKSLGGHFACLCRGFDFYEVKTNIIIIFQKENGNTFTLLIIILVKSIQKEQNSTNLQL